MEIHARRRPTIQDQENMCAIAGKGTKVSMPIKRHGLAVRGVLGDMNANIQAQREIIKGKVAVAAAEYEKKDTLNRTASFRSNYGHVQSKIDTGLASKPVQPLARPPLRREESITRLPACLISTLRTKAVLKDAENKPPKLKSSGSLLPAKKRAQDIRKPSQLSSTQEQVTEKENKVLKPILKEPTESLGKLKLAESTNCSEQSPQFIEKCTLIKLPDDIEDIDAADKNNPFLLSAYIKDIYKYLTELEVKFAIEPNHLKNQNAVTGRMRAILIDWLVEVQQQFSLLLETLQLAVGIIDRYLQAVPNVQRNRLQLIGVTALYIASKYEEIYSPDVGDFVYVTDNAYSKADLFQCERDMLSKLDYSLSRPIPLSFLRRFMKAAHGTSKQHHLAKYFVDLCLVEYTMTHYRPSELAAAALCLSLTLLSNKQPEEIWTPVLSFYSQYTFEHIYPIIRKIAKVVVDVDGSKQKSVYNKYLNVSLAKVSSLPQLKGATINELARTPS